MKGDKTFCFGTGREAYKKVVMDKKNLTPDIAVPGPGTYNPLHPIGTNAKKFKLKYKITYGEPDMLAIKRAIPGVGTYEHTLRQNDDGVYNMNSEWSNSKSAKWGPYHDRFKRVTTTPMITPGPGAHEQYGELK